MSQGSGAGNVPGMNIPGERFGHWVLVEQTNNSQWLARCGCGTEKQVWITHLRQGNSLSCGCRRLEAGTWFHGLRQSPEYGVWDGMIQRCTNPKSPAFYRYGERGITVCKRWADFRLFYKDMGPRPTPQHSLDRIDNDGNYEPANCRWATKHAQARNTRRNTWITIGNRRMVLADWAREHGLDPAVVRMRVRNGWDIERALNTPGRIQKNVKVHQVPERN
jgi:hypothetical protein